MLGGAGEKPYLGFGFIELRRYSHPCWGARIGSCVELQPWSVSGCRTYAIFNFGLRTPMKSLVFFHRSFQEIIVSEVVSKFHWIRLWFGINTPMVSNGAIAQLRLAALT